MKTDLDMGYAVLDGHEIRHVTDVLEWGRWYQDADRKVARDQVGEADVSTVFLGLNHGFGGRPLYFETMLFATNPEDPRDGSTWRYQTWDEAAAGHAAVVAALRDGTELPK